MSDRRKLSRTEREGIFLRSDGKCQKCGDPITIDYFHAAHLRSHKNHGPAIPENMEAWCVPCNLKWGSQDAKDTRFQPREWQEEALGTVVKRIINDQVATVSAAPGAGKTMFAGLVFETLVGLDIIDRMLILVPRKTLVEQWAEGLQKARHLELKCNAEVERQGQHGVVNSYQSLNDSSLYIHQTMSDNAAGRRTLVVLDEVHHVGEKHLKESAAWAKNVKKLAGVVDQDIVVRGVLNLSGTLWRSRGDERISTVRYIDVGGGRIRAQADHTVTAEELIKVGQLRPVDIYRLNARVEVSDTQSDIVTEADVCDLDEKPAARAAMLALSQSEDYRVAFVAAVLDRLQAAHRALGKYHVKALIVAPGQKEAYLFRDEVDRQMKERGWPPLAEIAVSDEGVNAIDTLRNFKKSKRVGVLCTVGMAGEGYDCPDIAVIGYASRTLTKMYIHQVIARAMRVTDYEREHGVIPAAVVIPDIPELVEHLIEYLKAYNPDVASTPGRICQCGHYETSHPELGPCTECDCPAFNPLTGPPPPPPPPGSRFDVLVQEVSQQRVTISDGREALSSFMVNDLSVFVSALVAQNVSGAEVLAPRILVALNDFRMRQPFDDIPDVDSMMNDVKTRQRTTEERAQTLQKRIRVLEGWWKHNAESECPVPVFAWKVNQAAGIPKGGRESATLEQLAVALDFARETVAEYCRRTGKKMPKRFDG